jgi:hypothetical protein
MGSVVGQGGGRRPAVNLWIRSSAGYFGAVGSSGKPGTDQMESEVGTSSKRRCGKNSGWNTRASHQARRPR